MNSPKESLIIGNVRRGSRERLGGGSIISQPILPSVDESVKHLLFAVGDRDGGDIGVKIAA